MKKILEINNISKSFKNKRLEKRQILDDISFDIYEGQIMGLVGPNGAGKSSLMKMITGILDADSGEIKTNSQIGALIEYPAIYPFLTGRDHMKLYSNNNKYGDIIRRLKMEEYIDKPTKDYSLGMKQKMGIAISLVNNPQFVILDEPMNGLDPLATKDLRDLILELNKEGITFLISSHIIDELEKIIDSVVILNQKKVVLNTSMLELQKQQEHQYRLVVDNYQRADELLNAAGITSTLDGKQIDVKLQAHQSLNLIVEMLVKNNIKIIDIRSNFVSLESILLNKLDNGGIHYA